MAVGQHALDGIDSAIDDAVASHAGSELRHTAWALLSQPGGSPLAAAAVVLAAMLCWRAGEPRTAVLIVAVSLTGAVLVSMLKEAYGRPYPFSNAEDVWSLIGRAYPSGHATGATLSWGAALLLGTRALRRRTNHPGPAPWAVWTWAAVAVVVGLDRVLIRVHWASDVVGAWLLSLALLGAAWMVDDRLAAPGPWRWRRTRLAD
jgi:undecaprenyl-diphosphatase